MISVQTILRRQHDPANFSELCRLCGKLKSPALSIYDLSYRTSYQDIINFYFKDLQISKTDVLPSKLCNDCAKFITSWHRFHKSCVQVNKALLSAVDEFRIQLVESESKTLDDKSDIEVIEMDVDSIPHDLDQLENLNNTEKSSNKLPETSVECIPGRYVFVDTNATKCEKDDEIVASKPPPSSTPPSANEESGGGDGAAGTTKCIICGSVFLKSKVKSAKNRGTCYSCYSKKSKTALTVSPIFENYLVTDENKQNYFLCDLCNFSCDAFPDVFSHHYKTEHPQANIYLEFVDETADPLAKFVREKNGVRSYRCDRCQMSCISRNVFAKHYAEHGDQSLQTGTLMIQFKDDKFCCAVCHKTYIHLNSAKRHLKRVHSEKKYHCGVCQKGFTYEHKAREHEKRHLKIKSFMCDICGRRFVDKGNLEKHLKKNLCSKYTCSWCNQSFKGKGILEDHLINCDQQKTNASDSAKIEPAPTQQNAGLINETLSKPILRYECAKCKKKFKSKVALRIHIVEEFMLSPYKCYVCDQRFSTTVLLKKHMNSCNKSILDKTQPDDFSLIVNTTSSDSFGCKLCGRTFRKIGYLRQHFRLHSKSKPFECQFCGKSYALAASYRSHISMEMDLRKFVCSVCGKRYNSSSHLTAHNKKHHRSREFKCNVCDKEFAYERDLKIHEKTHDETKAYCCDKCGGFFKTERYLKVHLERCRGSRKL